MQKEYEFGIEYIKKTGEKGSLTKRAVSRSVAVTQFLKETKGEKFERIKVKDLHTMMV